MADIYFLVTVQLQQDIGELPVDRVNLRMLQIVFLNLEILSFAVGWHLLWQDVYYPIRLFQILFYCHRLIPLYIVFLTIVNCRLVALEGGLVNPLQAFLFIDGIS